MYAILSHGGRQHRVSAGDRLVVDRLDAQVGSVIALEPVLLTAGDGTTALGDDVDGIRVAVTVVRHLRGKKLRVFKYKPKKRSRKMAGHRSDLTELRVESILARGAALPEARPATAAVAVDEPVSPAPRSRPVRAEPATKKVEAEPASDGVARAADPAADVSADSSAPVEAAAAPSPAAAAEHGVSPSGGDATVITTESGDGA